ncbi:MAG: FmdB family zinc ribbon protein [Terracidiphilus sp.]
MPLYAYRCTQCGHRFEKIQHFKSKPELICPKCQGVLERPLTAPGLHFKGSGFYVNDYSGKSATAESAPAAAASEAKPSCAGSCDACPAVAAAAATTPASTSSS